MTAQKNCPPVFCNLIGGILIIKKLAFLMFLIFVLFIMNTSLVYAETINFDDRKINDIAYMNGIYVVVGAQGLIYVSDDFMNWTKIDIGIDEDILYIKSNGEIFAAVGKDFAVTSKNGRQWNYLSSLFDKDYFPQDYWYHTYGYNVTRSGWFTIIVGNPLDSPNPKWYSTKDFVNFELRNAAIEDSEEIDKLEKQFTEETGDKAYRIMYFDDSIMVWTGSKVYEKRNGSDVWTFLGNNNSEYAPHIGNTTHHYVVKVFKLNHKIHVFREYESIYSISDDGVNFRLMNGSFVGDYKQVGDYILKINKDGRSMEYTAGDEVWHQLNVFYKPKLNFEKEANALVEDGLIQGTEKGLELLKPLTRIEATAILVRAIGLENATTQTEPVFSDMEAGSWGVKYANIASDKGITKGIGDNKFAPDQRIDANQFATLLLRSAEGDSFDWQQALNMLVERGIITQENADTMDLFTRGDMAKIIYEARQKGLLSKG